MKVEAANRLVADVLMNNGNATIGFDESRIGEAHELEGSSELPIYSLPPGHNLDDGVLKTGIDCDPEEAPSAPVADPGMPSLNAGARLRASMQSTEADIDEDSQSDSDIARTVKRVSDS